jgi:UDP-N-acetylglucosamine--N-acetylmuramyl-(pentapeptide) pyrophosphoryl-undecaprenol N-acetylglucosamine transferase
MGYDMKEPNILCLVAGGSGGHILPALLLGKKWLQENPTGKVIFFGGNKNIDKKIIEQNDFLSKIVYLNLIGFPGKKIWLYPKFLIQLIFTFIKSFYYLIKFRPNKVLSTGGYISVPICLTAKIFRGTVEIHELNVIPGKAVKFLLPFVDKVFITFESTKLFFKHGLRYYVNKCILKDYPIRFEEKDRNFDKDSLLKKINSTINCGVTSCFDQNKKTIFILGGSQGSIFLNEIFKKWILNNKNILDKIQVIHQTGAQDRTDWFSFYKDYGIPAVVFSYDGNIKDYYHLADLIVCRAGAGTLFELEFFRKRCLIIPLKTAQTDHQVDNALEMSLRNPELFSVQDQDLITKDFSFFEKELVKNLEL